MDDNFPSVLRPVFQKMTKVFRFFSFSVLQDDQTSFQNVLVSQLSVSIKKKPVVGTWEYWARGISVFR